MASDDLKSWLKQQYHNPNDKITNAQKLRSKFLPPKGVKTWGEWYDSVGIKPEDITASKGVDTEGKTTSSTTWHSQLTKAKTRQNLLEQELGRQDYNSASYKKVLADLNEQKVRVSDLQLRYDNAIILEKNLNKVDAAKTKTGKLKDQIASLTTARNTTADTGGDTSGLDSKIAELKKQLQATRKIVKETSTQPTGPQTAAGVAQPEVTKPTPTSGEKLPANMTAPSGTTPSATTTGTTGTTGTKTSGGKTTPSKVATPTDAQQTATGLEAASTDLSLPKTLFDHVPELKNLLNRYVKEDWTTDKLRQELRNSVWYKQNSDEVKKRYIQLYNYQDLVATGQATGNTDYEKKITDLENQLTKKAREIGSSLASDPAALRRAAENMYITNVGIDDSMTTALLAAAIKPVYSTLGGVATEGYSGQALKDYQTLQGIAKANGFTVADIVPGGQNERQVLQNIAKGAIDVNRIAQDARKLAAQGQPQYVRDLLGQGYDLNQIYAPYQKTMANVLEIDDPSSIDLNDPTLRSAISDQGDMNIYDFKKLLKQDKRWQYTENARQEVSDAAFKVLRDFGFQG